jgi:pantoate kinase
LSDPGIRRRINLIGEKLLETLKLNPGIREFLACSRKFAEESGLITRRVKKALEYLSAENVPCSMNMFGEAVFTVLEDDKLPEVRTLLEGYLGTGNLKGTATIVASKIDGSGGRVIGDEAGPESP